MSLIPFVSRAHYLQSGVLIGQQHETRSEINDKNNPEKKKKKKTFNQALCSKRLKI